ncbi:RNA polymerase sigma-70 factor (ECF subfamily) [Actinoplanes lutulentus]|uniref:RNA polymerase sigma-70 factor (ECF subfamily) n=1 Tax=Actinoplanes lutulentus TaxID=1287878 RepID=A0A327YYJ4_9ACTN|nr:siderophore-interacting protein [Actinoplanes lutulentus]MBB2940384.1 RNA polymerase sigma-70 factor (ECF subfamily) [Actinoplanes lutulentus]RAK25882.1 RNA polymerase sigma-70 factor (ECF subfamily) [Actinoplanes lutulentus]
MPDPHDDVVGRLITACGAADIDAIRKVLVPEAVAVCDGGVLPVVHGADDVAELVIALLGGPGELTPESVNGQAGLALRRAGRAVAVVAVTSAGERIAALWMVLHPIKLTGWHRP